MSGEGIDGLHNTMQKSLLDDLKKFILIHSEHSKFCLYSDYCLEDNEKHNKVASFTISPASIAFPEEKEWISNSLQTDIKKSRNISEKGVELLTNNNFFHINFVIKETTGVFYQKDKTSQDVALLGINLIIEMISKWIKNQPNGKEKFIEQKNKFLYWEKELKKKSANLKLAKQILLISMLASYIAYLLTVNANATDVVWFSDRDKIVNSYGNIAFDLFDINHFSMCEKFGAIEPYSQIGIVTSDSEPKNMWFDHLVRIPDYLAGTLASWDIKNNTVQKTKHSDILQKVFSENDFCAIINVDISRESYKFSRQTVSTLTNKVRL